MFIQTETTDNPDTIRFLPGETVYSEGPLFFDSSKKAINAPLAARLFELSDVKAVEIGVNSVSVTKMTQVDWLTLKPAVLGAIMDHFVSGQLAVIEEGKSISSERELGSGDELELDESDPIVVEIKDLIETRIRPAAVQSGGDIFLRGYKKGTAYFEFQGGASQLMSGLENMLRHYIPEINKIADWRDAITKPGLETEEAKAIQELLVARINPSVAAHGGHISLVDVQENTAYIRLEGGCQGCGMADVTLKQGIEVEIKKVVPSITNVLDATEHADGTNPYYQPEKGGMSPI